MFTVTGNNGNFYSLPIERSAEECVGISFEDGKAYLGMMKNIIEINAEDIDNLISVLEHVRGLVKDV